MKLITRNEWGARPPKKTPSKISNVLGIAQHWEGPEMPWPREHADCYSLVRGIQNFHMNTRNWNDLAYNAIPCPHGFVFQGRWLGVMSAAQGTNFGNAHYYAVCGLTGINNPFTDGLVEATWDAIVFFREHGAGQEVQPHSHFHATACPGPDYRNWINLGFPLPTPTPPPEPPPTPPTPLPDDWLQEAINNMETYDFRPVWNGAIITGAHVDNLQGLLLATQRADCDPGVVDGKGGPKTMGAVAAFQRIAGLTVDLIVGPQTWAKIIQW